MPLRQNLFLIIAALAFQSHPLSASTIVTFEGIASPLPGGSTVPIPGSFIPETDGLRFSGEFALISANPTNKLSSTALAAATTPITVSRDTPFRILSIDAGFRENSTDVPGPYQGYVGLNGLGGTGGAKIVPSERLQTLSFGEFAQPYGQTSWTIEGDGGPDYLDDSRHPVLFIDNLVIEDAPARPTDPSVIGSGITFAPTAVLDFENIVAPDDERLGEGSFLGTTQNGITLRSDTPGDVLSGEANTIGRFLPSAAFMPAGKFSITHSDPFAFAGLDISFCGLGDQIISGSCSALDPLAGRIDVSWELFTTELDIIPFGFSSASVMANEVLRFGLPDYLTDFPAEKVTLSISAIFEDDPDRRTVIFVDNIGVATELPAPIPLPASGLLLILACFGFGVLGNTPLQNASRSQQLRNRLGS